MSGSDRNVKFEKINLTVGVSKLFSIVKYHRDTNVMRVNIDHLIPFKNQYINLSNTIFDDEIGYSKLKVMSQYHTIECKKTNSILIGEHALFLINEPLSHCIIVTQGTPFGPSSKFYNN